MSAALRRRARLPALGAAPVSGQRPSPGSMRSPPSNRNRTPGACIGGSRIQAEKANDDRRPEAIGPPASGIQPNPMTRRPCRDHGCLPIDTSPQRTYRTPAVAMEWSGRVAPGWDHPLDGSCSLTRTAPGLRSGWGRNPRRLETGACGSPQSRLSFARDGSGRSCSRCRRTFNTEPVSCRGSGQDCAFCEQPQPCQPKDGFVAINTAPWISLRG